VSFSDNTVPAAAAVLLQGYGVYRFQDKYGANVDGYSPIYTPDLWTEGGDSYKLGTKGLIAW
jgi:photosystem II protein